MQFDVPAAKGARDMATDETEDPKDGEEPDEEGEEGGAKRKKKKKQLPLLIAVVVLITAALGAASYFLGVFDDGSDPDAAHSESGAESGETNADGTKAPGLFYYDLEEFVVNLNVGSNSPSFLKMKVSLELGSALEVPAIEAGLPRIRDSFHIYLRELRRSDLKGAEGIYRLREELLLRINKITYPTKIRDILFKEILIQ
jgi:flagellar FliL protein